MILSALMIPERVTASRRAKKSTNLRNGRERIYYLTITS